MTAQKKILLVEDSPESRKLFMDFMDGVPLEIDAAENAKQALENCERTQYDYIFLDMQLPDSNGFKVFNEIHETPTNLKTKVIAFTAAASAHEAELYQAKGFYKMVPKPFTPNTLRMALNLA